MITIEEIVKLDAWKSLTSEGRQYITSAVQSEPARLVGVGGLMNQSGSFASRASGHTLQWESRSVELVFLHKAELDPKLLCVWDQPPPLSIAKHDFSGRRYPSRWTPDYLSLKSNKFYLWECKPIDGLIELEQSESGDWDRQDDVWTWNPAATVCGTLGIDFNVFHSGMYSSILAGNLAALVTSSRESLSKAHLSTLKQIRNALVNGPLNHASLLIRFARATGDLLLQGLIAGELYGALSSSLIGENFLYYHSAEDAKSREQLIAAAADKDGRSWRPCEATNECEPGRTSSRRSRTLCISTGARVASAAQLDRLSLQSQTRTGTVRRSAGPGRFRTSRGRQRAASVRS